MCFDIKETNLTKKIRFTGKTLIPQVSLSRMRIDFGEVFLHDKIDTQLIVMV
jgi:hypothetical protein